MNIVFQVDKYFPNTEAPARRITGLAENLVKLGNKVDVICPFPDYIDGKKEIRDINMGYMEKYRQDRQIH